jgi:hypothetical protein
VQYSAQSCVALFIQLDSIADVRHTAALGKEFAYELETDQGKVCGKDVDVAHGCLLFVSMPSHQFSHQMSVLYFF